MSRTTDKFPIDVAASVISDISVGIYRTPAGALKELISNAFDADAHTVRLSTNAPHFRTFTCSDDGVGMTRDAFLRNMTLIGGSAKRDHGETSPFSKRPLIGRIGIGLLSIAQICKRFEVISSARGHPEKFKATIDLLPYMRAEARRRNLGDVLDPDKKIRLGEGEIEVAPEDSGKQYTRIVMHDIVPGFQQQLRSVPMEAGGMTPAKFSKGTMRSFIRDMQRSGRVANHGAYAQLIWELATTAPVQYMEDGPVTGYTELADLKARIAGYQFQVFVDNVELFKPIVLPTSNDVRHSLFPNLDLNAILSDGRAMSVRGYLFWQSSSIRPREQQGILVRVRNVGVGGFDSAFLGYPKSEGWKFSQLCGELYVDQGLDEAINIDRASFRETDEAYTKLQEFLFERLGKRTDEGAGIFTTIKAGTDAHKQTVARQETARKRRQVAKVLKGPRSQSKPTGKTKPTGGVDVIPPQSVQSAEALTESVPKKHRELFAAVVKLLEQYLSDNVEEQHRTSMYAKMAELFRIF